MLFIPHFFSLTSKIHRSHFFSFTDGDTSHDIIIAAIIGLIISFVLFSVYVVIQALRVYTGRDGMMVYLKARLPIRLEETILFFGVFCWSLFLIARVLKGQCPPGTSLWEQQTCNQFASQGGIPTELACSLYLAPVCFQLYASTLSIRTLVISHITTLAVVMFCIIYSQAWNDSFVLINWLFFSNISFEIERLHRLSFKELINANDLQVLSLKRAQEVHLLKEEQERSR